MTNLHLSTAGWLLLQCVRLHFEGLAVIPGPHQRQMAQPSAGYVHACGALHSRPGRPCQPNSSLCSSLLAHTGVPPCCVSCGAVQQASEVQCAVDWCLMSAHGLRLCAVHACLHQLHSCLHMPLLMVGAPQLANSRAFPNAPGQCWPSDLLAAMDAILGLTLSAGSIKELCKMFVWLPWNRYGSALMPSSRPSTPQILQTM